MDTSRDDGCLRNTHLRLIVTLAIAACALLTSCGGPGAPASGTPPASATTGRPRWKTLVLWTSPTLSATLTYKTVASLADEDYMYVEFNNRTWKALDVQQAWLSLPGTRVNLATKTSVFMSDLTAGVLYNGK